MKFKILYFILISALIFNMSAVSSLEDVSDISDESDSYELNEITDINAVSESENDALSLDEYTFKDLASKIDSYSDNVTVSGTYKFNPVTDGAYLNGININKLRDFTIIGENLIVDGGKQAKAFNINSDAKIQLLNITFINCLADNNDGIVSINTNTMISNSKFINNSGISINSINGEITITDCTFINAKAISNAGNMIISNIQLNGSEIINYANLSANSFNGYLVNISNFGSLNLTRAKLNNAELNNFADLKFLREGFSNQNEVKSSRINNRGNILFNTGCEFSNISNSGNITIDWYVHIVNNNLLNNGGNISYQCYVEYCNITNRAGIINMLGGYTGLSFINNSATIDIKGMNLYYDEFLNNGEIKAHSLAVSINTNNITNYGVLDLNRTIMNSCNMDNCGIFKARDNLFNFNEYGSNSDMKTNLKNTGTINIFNSQLFNFNITNNNTIKIKDSNMYDINLTNVNGTIFYDNVNISNGSTVNNGTIQFEKSQVTNHSFVNDGNVAFSKDSIFEDVEIEKTNATLIINKVIMNYDQIKYLTLKVTNDNAFPVSSVDLKIRILNKEYNAISDNMGIVIFKIPLLNVGTYDVSVNGENYFINPVENITQIKISAAKTSVKAPKKTFKYKKSRYYKITIKRSDNKKAIKYLKIKVKVYTGKKYKTYKLKTNKKGVAQINTKKLKRGKHKLVITSLNKNYKISKKTTIKIK